MCDTVKALNYFPNVLRDLILDYYYPFKFLHKEVINELTCKFSTGPENDWTRGSKILMENKAHFPFSVYGAKYFIQSRILYRINGQFDEAAEKAFNYHKNCLQ